MINLAILGARTLHSWLVATLAWPRSDFTKKIKKYCLTGYGVGEKSKTLFEQITGG
jgi:hypothetical protein